MKIVHVFFDFPSENQIYNSKLIKRLETESLKSQITIFSKAKIKNNNFNISSVSYHKKKWFFYLLKSIENYKLFKEYKKTTKFSLKIAIKYFGRFAILLKINPDVVHVHHIQLLQSPFLNFLTVCKFKIVVSLRGSDLLVRPLRTDADKDYLIKVVETIKNVHLVSNHLKLKLQELEPQNVNYFVIHRTAEIDKKIKLVNVQKEDPIILTVGRVHWTKGYKIAIEALNLLKFSGAKFTYHICGGYTVGDKDELNYWINRYNLEDNIVFHGHLSSEAIDDLMGIATVYLQSSLSEGIPNTLLRALYNRIPTVTTDAGGIPEIFQNEVDGFMVETGNSQMIFLKLKELLMDKEFQERIKKSNNLNVSNHSQEMKLYKKMYEKVATM